MECIGRADDQVKIRGFRIELGEIDTYLGQHPHVRENKTRVMRDANEEKQLISFFVPQVCPCVFSLCCVGGMQEVLIPLVLVQDQKNYSIEEIRAYLKTKLPVYAVPTVLCPLKKMPLTPNGKVDSNRLPYPDTAMLMAQRGSAQPEDDGSITPLQRQLMGIWEKVSRWPRWRQANVQDPIMCTLFLCS